MRVRSGYEVVGQLPHFDEAIIREEPNLFGATAEDVDRVGGPIAKAFVALLPEAFKAQPFWVRSKLQWLKAGWRTGSGPGGYHCDQVGARADGEQDHVNRSTPGKHTIGAAVGDVALTRFAVGEFELPDYPVGQPQGLLWHCALLEAVARGEVQEVEVPAGGMLRFGEGDFHRTGVAHRTGWRLFIRATHRRAWDSGQTRDLDLWNRASNGYAPTTVSEAALFARYGNA